MIQKRGKRWRVVVQCPPDPLTGKRHQLSGSVPSEREAVRLERDLRLRAESGARRELTFAELVEEWWASPPRLAATTAKNYRENLDNHVLPVLGAKKVREIRPRLVGQFMAKLLADRHTAGYLQSSFKLGRTYGTANLAITHRVSDLAAQADDGSATAKIAAGLLADSATKIILRQAPDQLASAATHFRLTDPEVRIIGHLTRGRALWKIGAHTTLVDHVVAPSESALVDTDARMTANPGGFRITEGSGGSNPSVDGI